MQFAAKSVVPIAVAAASVLSLTAGTQASVSQICFSVRARAIVDGVEQTALFEVSSDQMYYDEASFTYGWDLQSPLELRSQQGTLLGTLMSANVLAVEDPEVHANFSVQSGAVMTSFDIISTQVGFAATSNMIGAAVATLAADDRNDGFVSVAPLGSFPGNAIYVARYNNSGLPLMDLDGTTFAGLLVAGPYSAVAPNGVNAADNTGAFLPIPGSVQNIQAGFSFSLTPGDIASGNSSFIVIPTPGAAVLCGLAGLVAFRRRR